MPFSTLSRVLGGETLARAEIDLLLDETFSTLSRVLGGETGHRRVFLAVGLVLSVPYRGYWGVKPAALAAVIPPEHYPFSTLSRVLGGETARRDKAARPPRSFQYPIAGIGG